MRNLKKFLALVLAMIMVVSAAAVVSADFTDVAADNQYAEAINDLAVKKIIVGTTETTFSPDADVQRYQMALLVARATTGIVDNDEWANGVKIFDDVTADHFKGAISYAYVNGIIRGRDAKTFDPAGNIAYIDALTMAVRALGFNDLEYPMGYFKKASELGLTENVAVYELDTTLDRAETAQIIYNMIYVVRENGLTMAAEYFDRVVVRTTDLFVISCTPKQTYVAPYKAVTNKDVVYVGVQPLVNGVPSGEVMYLTNDQLGIEKADVENYFNYAVELINYDATTGKFDEAKLGEAPDSFRQADDRVATATNTIKLDKTYDIVSAISNNVLRNEVVVLAGDNTVAPIAKTLVTDVAGNVYYGDNANSLLGTPVARAFQFSGSTLKYYAALVDGYNAAGTKIFNANTIISEDLALEAWGFITDKVEYTKYDALSATAIAGKLAYQLDCFDDNKDGDYDRVFVNTVYLSSYTTSGTGADTVVNNVAGVANNVKLSEITFTDTSVQQLGTLYAYTYNSATKTVKVIDTAEVKQGTLTLVDATRYQVSTNGRMTFVIDGVNHHIAQVIGNGVNWNLGADKIGANLITDDVAPVTFNNFATKGDFAVTNGYDWINTAKVGIQVNYITYNKLGANPILLFIEPVAGPAAPTLAKNMVIMTGANDVDLDSTWSNITTKLWLNGVATQSLIEKIDGQLVADLSIKEVSALLYKDELFYPGLIYNATKNADGEYTVLDDAFNPYVAADLTEFGLLDGSVSATAGVVNFLSGVTTVPNYDQKIFTDKDTVFYFIDRTENGQVAGTTWYAEGAKTTVTSYVGAPTNASITLGADGMIFVDKIGITAGDFANVVIVYEAASINGFGTYENSSSIVYVPVGPDKVTVAGTAAALGLTDAKYTEEKYYKYANAAIDLQTGAKVDIITTEILDATNTDAIYELDANKVVIVRQDDNKNPLPGRTSKFFMTRAEAVTLGVLTQVNGAVLTYTPFAGGNFVVLHNQGMTDVAIGYNNAVASVTAFPVAGDPNPASGTNFKYNAEVNGTSTTPALINGNKTVWFLSAGLTDGSVTVLYN